MTNISLGLGRALNLGRRAISFAILAAVIVAAAATFPHSALADGTAYNTLLNNTSPSMWWKLNETSGNFADSGFNTSIVGTASTGGLTRGSTGPAANASSVAFSGSASSVNVAYDGLMNPNGMSFSIAAWVYPTLASTAQDILNSREPDGSIARGYWLRQSATNKAQFCAATGSAWVCANSATSMTLNTWHFIVGTVKFNGTTPQQVRVYLDGSLDGTASISVFSENGHGALRMGAVINNLGTYITANAFHGSISHVSFYRWALEEEATGIIANLYNTMVGPNNTAVPTISGTLIYSNTLTASTGTWNGSPTSYTYQWMRCDSAGANCSDISGATSSTYVLTGSDVTYTIKVKVSASNGTGTNSAFSTATGVVHGYDLYGSGITCNTSNGQGTVTVSNQGYEASPALTNGILIRTSIGTVDEQNFYVNLPTIVAGQSATVNWTSPNGLCGVAANHEYAATFDPSNLLPEIYEDNNVYTV